jgi:hypothetical protein
LHHRLSVAHGISQVPPSVSVSVAREHGSSGIKARSRQSVAVRPPVRIDHPILTDTLDGPQLIHHHHPDVSRGIASMAPNLRKNVARKCNPTAEHHPQHEVGILAPDKPRVESYIANFGGTEHHRLSICGKLAKRDDRTKGVALDDEGSSITGIRES